MEEPIYFRLNEISGNNGKNQENTWILINNCVYDVTDYMKDHPGGPELIEEYAGKDATKAFDDFGHSNDALKKLKRLKIGELHPEESSKKNKPVPKDSVQDKSSSDNRIWTKLSYNV